ncbi:hypothetical protein C0J52_19293, partial [Blattella germanica]
CLRNIHIPASTSGKTRSKFQTRSVGTGFFPGQASFAYFFFFGSWLSSAAAAKGPCGITVGGNGAGAISTSGAGFGSARPSREANADENNNGSIEEACKKPAVTGFPCESSRQQSKMEWGLYEDRIPVLALHRCGKRAKEIATMLKPIDINERFVFRTIARFKETGEAIDRIRSGRPKTVRTERVVNAVRLINIFILIYIKQFKFCEPIIIKLEYNFKLVNAEDFRPREEKIAPNHNIHFQPRLCSSRNGSLRKD